MRETYLQIYIGLGENRSLEKVCEITGKSFSYISKLSAKEKWKEKAAESDNAITQMVKEQYQERTMKLNETSLSLAQRIYQMLEDNLDSIEIKTIRDAKILLEMYNLLTGRATQITQEVAPTANPIDIEKLTDEEFDTLATLAAKLWSEE